MLRTEYWEVSLEVCCEDVTKLLGGCWTLVESDLFTFNDLLSSVCLHTSQDTLGCSGSCVDAMGICSVWLLCMAVLWMNKDEIIGVSALLSQTKHLHWSE